MIGLSLLSALMNTGAEARANFAALRGPFNSARGKLLKCRSPTVLSCMGRFYGQSAAREMIRVSQSSVRGSVITGADRLRCADF
jgi:hypothetical protein